MKTSAALCLLLACTLHAGTPASDAAVTEGAALAKWWDGKGLTGEWFGLREAIANRSLTFHGKYYGAFFGVIRGAGNNSRGFWDQGLQFGAEQNFGKLLGVEALSGVKGFGGVRWRDPRSAANPNEYAQASSLFSPTNWASGTQWRLLSFGLEAGTADHLPVKDMIVLRGGWLQPQTEFIDQPLSKLFLNNAVNSAKGVGGNISFSSSFSTWGGTLKVKPVEMWYVKGGLFMAYPQGTASSNHGLAMAGYAQDPNRNGFFAMGETGLTPKLGVAEFPGKFAVGGYYWGVENTSFFGQNYDGQWGLYGQADQMLFRESTSAPEPDTSADGKAFSPTGKDFKSPVPLEKTELGKQGLYAFSLVTFAPKSNNTVPFYFQTGLDYIGLIPGRDRDQALLSLAYGAYSFSQIQADQQNGVVNQPNYSGILEAGYRIQINSWAFVQPFAQYLFRPNGTGAVENCGVLGFYTGVDF